ncbi:MAG TPA: hypothetical protein VH302_04560 [Bryobacteraceae bacterium]|nr:hypothetical protein [Bryobacteraceae bacterium]
MELPQAAPEVARQRLTELREKLLILHKALLDSERTSYELIHGPIASPGAFLQLLINDARFAWLRPVTTMIVQIDEALAAKNPPSSHVDFERLIGDVRALLTPSSEENGFWKRYSGAVQRDPGVAVLHEEMERHLS